jgi:serine/threonine protein kinase
LAAAVTKPFAEREAFLDAACAGDPTLRRDVDQYLYSDKTEQFVYHPEPAVETIEQHVRPAVETVEHQVRPTGDPKLGKVFGKYIIQRRVAEGGMGIVYLAVDKQLGRDVALKILPEFFSMDKERITRFHREARATSLLNHPNIVTVFELGQMDGCEFIVTEYVEGETLREKMNRGQVPFVEMIKLMTQVASALAAAHKAGIIHRDIKPENIMVRPDGYVKVLDFGLAKLSEQMGKRLSAGDLDISQHNATTPGMIMGTASYMSPEQADGADTDARTDIWAVGVILYEMASGELPFDGPTQSHTIVAILEQEPKPIEHASPELRQIIATALQKDRQLRFQTADALGEALDGLKHRLGYVSDQHISSPTVVQRPTLITQQKPRKSNKLLWLLPAAFVALLIGVLGIYGVATLLSRFGSARNDNSPPRNAASPAPTSTVAAASPEPTTTPLPAYVDPTPEPTDTPGQRAERTPKPIVQQPQHTPEPQVQKTPIKRPKPTQDPNCVFTNSCH